MEHSLVENSKKARSRSNTAQSLKTRKRPLSRGSTASISSGTTHNLLDQQLANHEDYQKRWYEQDPNMRQRFGSVNHQMTAEDMVIHSAAQLQNPIEYKLDPSMHPSGNHAMPYSQEMQYKPELTHHPNPVDGYGGNFGEGDSQLVERSDEQEEVDSLAGVVGPSKKPSKASAQNELEMKQLFQSNKHRSLPEVATELHGNERGPQSERQRQVFAMIWISQVCGKGTGSVPRGRVYANYVSRCATERVTVLNPASFGKLVRVLFPGLKTRRLGIRGESKYHYVNFSLKDDQPEMNESQTKQPVSSFSEQPSFNQSFNQSIQSQFPIDRATFPSPAIAQAPEQPAERTHGFVRPHSLYNQPDIRGIDHLESTSQKISQRLQFPKPSEPPSLEHEAISLPKIEQFLPIGTDPDSASALMALYRSHCTSLVECMRYCKEKTFFHLFTSFHGTLTMPVQKLFANPSLSPWIEQCDFVMYQKMMRVVAPLTLQVAPKPVLDTLRNISERLVAHIRVAFQGQPSHVIDAKVAPATLFAGLLDRELRVNLTAHAAANMLSNPANRDQMYEDWITMVRTRKVAECVPSKGMDDLVNLLLTDLRDLLDPLAIPWEIECQTPYGEMALRTGRQQQASIHADSSTENVLDRWVSFLTALPEKFPYATHAEIVWCVQSVGTAVMRDLTINQGKSFGAWWVTKCWIDEMIAFMAEQGGFMEYKTARATKGTRVQQQSDASRAASIRGSRYSSGSEGFATLGDGLSRPMEATSQAAMNAAAGHDDSGIGMRTPEDDFTSMGKYEYRGNTTHTQMMPNNMNNTVLHVSVA
ncbi:RFX DNA-binding domain-containing protein [Phlyctema vagabunda]|uniref:RFX DNA-binding domain-containing protein n=1 Tax=Phlyctema vagabunda TaxID=108571 RepID=A0ABR4PUR5_9HELO